MPDYKVLLPPIMTVDGKANEDDVIELDEGEAVPLLELGAIEETTAPAGKAKKTATKPAAAETPKPVEAPKPPLPTASVDEKPKTTT